MGAPKPRSRKPSGSRSWQPDPGTVYFLDENLGGETISSALRELGATVEVHRDHFAAGTDDETWLTGIAERGWTAVTRDKNIRLRPNEIAAIRRCGARVIVVTGGSLTGHDIAALLCRKLKSIEGFTKSHRGSFVATLAASGHLKEFKDKT